MVIVKRRPLPTRALGTEPNSPDIPALAAWVAERREVNEAGDLTTYQITQALAPQLGAGITAPCAGGIFYKTRLLSSFTGIEERIIIGETEVVGSEIIADCMELACMKKRVWCALPAPHILSISDSYYGDEDEAAIAVAGLYRSAMRSMRDAGIGGHILICNRTDDAELSTLSRRNVFFFHPDPNPSDIGLLLEYQNRVAVPGSDLPAVFGLSSEYDLNQVIILNADVGSITLALSHMDPDQIVIGGYCTGPSETYWKEIADNAFYSA